MLTSGRGRIQAATNLTTMGAALGGVDAEPVAAVRDNLNQMAPMRQLENVKVQIAQINAKVNEVAAAATGLADRLLGTEPDGGQSVDDLECGGEIASIATALRDLEAVVDYLAHQHDRLANV